MLYYLRPLVWVWTPTLLSPLTAMKMHIHPVCCRFAALVLGVLFLTVGFSAQASDFLLTNDDGVPNGVSVFIIAPDGSLTLQGQITLPGYGMSGGYFGLDRLAVLNSASNQCIFASEAYTGDIASVAVANGDVVGTFIGSPSDTGVSNGIGLVANSQYLYASFTDSSTIGTFQINSGCSLSFVNDVSVGGLQGGIIGGMAVHGNLLIATYLDGSIESFDISLGTPVSNGDKQNSTGSKGGATYPNGIDITQDGHFAIFGDTSTADVVEVSDISSGRLTKTAVYRTYAGISSSNILLSPDETFLFITNTQGDVVSAAHFDVATGHVTRGCTSNRISNYVDGWSYLGGLALQQITGNGGGVYVTEFGAPSAVSIVNLSVNGSTCTLSEATSSPAADPNSLGLLSLGRFPPRSF